MYEMDGIEALVRDLALADSQELGDAEVRRKKRGALQDLLDDIVLNGSPEEKARAEQIRTSLSPKKGKFIASF